MLCVRWLGSMNTTWENLQFAKHKSVTRWFRSVNWFVLCELQTFLGSVHHPEPPHAKTFFLFPIVFGINLILFFDQRTTWDGEFEGIIRSMVLHPRSLIAPFEKVGPKSANFFGNRKCELTSNFSATMVTIWKGRNEKCEFLARESVNSSPILARQWGRHFRLSLSVSLSLSLSLSLSHRAHRAHNIGNASALPIIYTKR